MESSEVRIKRRGDDAEFRSELVQNWDPGYVADITLVDGTVVAAVLIGISNSALILDRWDSDSRSPADDPFTLDLMAVAEVVVP
ncbi:MAG TPA: hypothetical protein VGI44_18755 [Acidimicrobiales bacterium]